MLIKKNTKAFTLVEILLGIVIVSMVMVSAFQALTSIGVGKIRLIQKTQTQKQVLYFSEKLFEMIKYGGTIDYEEYFARKIRNNYTPLTSEYLSGHYVDNTGFGNYATSGYPGTLNYKMPPIPNEAEFYYCRSDGTLIGSGGCYDDNTLNDKGVDSLAGGFPQAYGQYSFQFIDYNSNGDSDGGILGDEDGNGIIIGDDDDEYLGEGPEVFPLGSDTKELYLINGVKRERTYFRYNVGLDPDRPSGSSCDTLDNGATYSGSGCLGTIEYLKLEGRDWGMDHSGALVDSTQYDGVIDTWVIDPEFTSGGSEIIAGTNNTDQYWQPLFSDNIHVTEFKVFPHPNIDTDRAWKNDDPSQNIAEYVRIQLGMMPSWKERKKIKGTPQEFKMSTTINLTDIFTR